ncbi:lipoyl(octanoyl) transferase LipB [Candidatus Pelagibacter sp.]|nr:lipoyl(octanoyl) transferase LipB [Candidatus Pelagibacter sp.]
MKIEIKKSKKPVKYIKAIEYLEKRLSLLKEKKAPELIWILEHENVFTGGSGYNEKDILDKSIKVIKTNRGGKITCHNSGQLICYFLIDLNNRKKDIKKFINLIEKIIIRTLSEYKIKSFNDPKNIGIWVNHENQIKKIAAIGIRVSKWIAYHGFSINIKNDISDYKKIIPCGIKDKGITNLKLIKNQNYNDISNKIIKNFVKYLEI